MANKRHVLLATFPAQGHINPSLQFAERLLNTGRIGRVTFFTSVYALKRMPVSASGPIEFVAFSDSYDDGLKNPEDGKNYMSEMRRRGAMALKDTLAKYNNDGENNNRVSFVVYSHLFSWAAEVAREANVPSALLWIEPATVFNVFYFYFNGYADDIDGGSERIRLPNLPPLSKRDLPSFLHPSTPARFRALMKEKFETLDMERPKAKVLINTFDALEPEQLKAIERYDLTAIGPIIPPAIFSANKDGVKKSYGGDLFRKTDESYVEWLDSKPESSVVYISFGSMLRLPKPQMEEIAKGLAGAKLPFLWVIRRNEGGSEEEQAEEEEKLAGFFDGGTGKIVAWCSQLDVLTHRSVGCFVTHCGWNSAIESLACGVPVVCFPQWFDQGTNAKMIEDVWRSGVRVRVRTNNGEEGFVDGHEIERCIMEVMDGGTKSQELRANAMKWKCLAKEAMDGDKGSSCNNLKNFVEGMIGEDIDD